MYWKPLYLFARGRGLAPAAAEDAIQGLFADLLDRDFLQQLDPARGRLRSFLRTSLVFYLSNQRSSARAARRGGGVAPVDLGDVESEVADLSALDPERALDRLWARALLARAMTALRSEYEQGTRSGSFALIERFFGDSPPSYAEVTAEAGMTVPQLKSFLHRARLRYRELVRAEVAETVASPDDIDAELQGLLASLGD